MASDPGEAYADVAEAAWRWVLKQVRWDDGPWLPASVTDPAPAEPAWDRDGMHSGIGGLAHVLAEIRLSRAWTAEEEHLAAGIADRLRASIPTQVDVTFFDGLVSSVGVLLALEEPGADRAVARLAALSEPDGWPQTTLKEPAWAPDTRIHDLTLGTAGVLLGSLWAHRHGLAGAVDVAHHAADVLLREAEQLPTGSNWHMAPARFRRESTGVQMPNLSHGIAGIATALALAGTPLARPELTEAAVAGARHLVSLGESQGNGFVVPRYLPRDYNDQDEITYTWCHGAAGTSLLFVALDHAGVTDVAGDPPRTWQRRLLRSVRDSGLPERLHPGFWDNDGRCCGTAGVGEVFLDCWHRGGDAQDLEFATHLADVLVERAVRDGPHAYWRFLEHRAAEPLLPPGTGWMQGAAGIAAYLFRMSRVVRGDPAPAVARMDNWWALGSA